MLRDRLLALPANTPGRAVLLHMVQTPSQLMGAARRLADAWRAGARGTGGPAVFVGQTRSRALIKQLEALQFGEVTQRGELPPRRQPWFFDNLAFSDWQAGRAFDAVQFERDLRWITYRVERGLTPPPLFIVLPDLPARGDESLAFSLSYFEGAAQPLSGYPAPVYLVVQDGMTTAQIEDVLMTRDIAGLFVGGTLAWKQATMGAWIDCAHRMGRKCHVGRAGGHQTLRLAIEAGADSIDTSLALWSQQNLDRFVAGLQRGRGRRAVLDSRAAAPAAAPVPATSMSLADKVMWDAISAYIENGEDMEDQWIREAADDEGAEERLAELTEARRIQATFDAQMIAVAHGRTPA